MRLIDADALKSECRDIIQNYETRYDDYSIGKCGGMTQAMNEIDNAPNIAAIPVEWLVDLKNEYAREGREQAEGDLMNLLLMWQKEQEAHST